MAGHASFYPALLVAVIMAAPAVAMPRSLPNEDKAYWMKSAQDTLKNALQMTFNKGVAKNVILFLGDGMGVSTVTAARIYKGQKAGQPGEETQLNFEKFPHVALSKTYNTDHQTADSAGTATAFLCGVKGNYGTLGVDSRVARGDCTNINNTDTHTTSIMQWALDAGKSTGIVTTTRLTHATPGAAYAHTPDRDWETDRDIPDKCPGLRDIAYQLLNTQSNINVMLGGGKREFYNRKDNRSLPEEWVAAKRQDGKMAQYVQTATDLRAVDTARTDHLLGVFSESHMSYEVSRDDSQQPSLSEMTRKAIEILQRNEDNGFFLLVEGGRIDHGHHDNYAKVALEETVMFDAALAVTMEMTGDDTLVVVTADHSHVFNIAGYSTRGHDILDLANSNGVPTDGMPYATLVYANGPGHGREQNLTGVNMTTDYFQSQRLVPFGTMSETHAGEDVAIYATGPMSHLFHGVHEQNYIAHVMGYAACLGPNKDHCKSSTSGVHRKSCFLTTALLAVAAQLVLADRIVVSAV